MSAARLRGDRGEVSLWVYLSWVPFLVFVIAQAATGTGMFAPDEPEVEAPRSTAEITLAPPGSETSAPKATGGLTLAPTEADIEASVEASLADLATSIRSADPEAGVPLMSTENTDVEVSMASYVSPTDFCLLGTAGSQTVAYRVDRVVESCS